MDKKVKPIVLLVVFGLSINQQLTQVNGGIVNALIGAGDALSTLKSMSDCPHIECLIKKCVIEPKEKDGTGCAGACLIKELKIGTGPKKDAYSKDLYEMKNKACGYLKYEVKLHKCILKNAPEGANTCKQFDTVQGMCIDQVEWNNPDEPKPCPT